MSIPTTARLLALELLITELLSAYLLATPDSEGVANWAVDHLHNVVDGMSFGNGNATDIETVRKVVKDDLSRILKVALEQANKVGRQRWDAETDRGLRT